MAFARTNGAGGAANGNTLANDQQDKGIPTDPSTSGTCSDANPSSEDQSNEEDQKNRAGGGIPSSADPSTSGTCSDAINPSSGDESNQEDQNNRAGQHPSCFEKYIEAMQTDDPYEAIVEHLNQFPTVDREINSAGETALHIAVIHRRDTIVELLVGQMSVDGLKIKDDDGETALMVAAVLGYRKVAECMLQKFPDHKKLQKCSVHKKALFTARSKEELLPVVKAIDFMQIEMARYLYSQTSLEELQDPNNEGLNGAIFLTRAIYCEAFDIALHLIRKFPKLALARDSKYSKETPILALANITHCCSSAPENHIGFWKKCINYFRSGIPASTSPASETHSDVIPNGDQSNQENQNNRSGGGIPALTDPPTIETCLVDVISSGDESNQEDQNNRAERENNQLEDNYETGIYELQEIRKLPRSSQYEKLLSQMFEGISKSNPTQLYEDQVYAALGVAARNGNFKFIKKMIEVDISFLWTIHCDMDNRRNIFMIAVLHRQEKIFNILYEREERERNYLTGLIDKHGNSILHLAGMVENSTRLNRLSGAALQMQRELQWFKEVEKMVHPKFKVSTNQKGLTPRQLFTQKHEDMMEKGEKWMKDTATSCTVVAAFIITIIFPTVFTMPGEKKARDTRPFKFFMICDALSLCFSTISVWMFLGILTSRYSENDFLERLQRKMILGLFSLFLAITTMLAVFTGAVLIQLNKEAWLVFLLVFFVLGIASFVFILMVLCLLISMICSTYFPRIFDGKSKANR